MRNFAVLILASFFFYSVHGQNRISVAVTDGKNPLDNITAELMRPDSVLVKTAISGKTGVAEFEDIGPGEYFLRFSSVSHVLYYTNLFILKKDQLPELPTVVLTARQAGSLQEVTVVSKKPFIQRLSDRIVVNVENSIVSAGSTALEVLEKSPGVTINSADNISLKGKQGVLIYIDGKPSAMSGQELITYLRSLPAAMIQQIDIIANPSAKYDAAGNAGIIDIRLKKNQRLGTNGSFTTGYSQGIYPRANVNSNFNSRGKKLNVFGSASYNYIDWLNNIIVRRDFYEAGNYSGSYDQDNFIKRKYDIAGVRAGVDYYANAKTIIGVLVNGSLNYARRSSNNQSKVLDQNQQLSSIFTTLANGSEKFRNLVTNVNFKHSFDTTGREITVDLDYARFIQDWAAGYLSNYYDKDGDINQPPYVLSNDQDGNLQIRSAKVDYVLPFKGSKLEAGIKTSFVKADNRVLFFNGTGSSSPVDSSMSNHFLYNENINAAYLNYHITKGKWELQLGLRGEATHLKTEQLFYKLSFDSSYFQLFPAVFVTYHINDDHSLGFSVSRRIDRPTYGQLNPFRIFVDPSFYAAGDPNLLPQISWSTLASYSFKQFSIELNYSKTRQLLTYVLMPTANRVTLQTAVNFKSQDYAGLTIAAPITITKWWNSVNNLEIFYNNIQGFVAETDVNANYLNAIVSSNNTFTLGKSWTGEINININTGNKNGVMMDLPAYGLAAGIQKTMLKGKGTGRLGITDILWRTYPRFKSKYTTYRESLVAIRDTRQINLSFTYRFGNSKVQAARRRTTASEEERRRAGGN